MMLIVVISLLFYLMGDAYEIIEFEGTRDVWLCKNTRECGRLY